jgi:hypothetical protein
MPVRPLPGREPLFLDSAHLIALFSPRDNWRDAAIAAADSVQPRQPFVTSEGVFLETLAHFTREPRAVRTRLGRWITSLRADPHYTIVPHDQRLSEAALDLYTSEFADSTFSLQDCAEIVIMREYGITSILTADQEFARAGFTPLLRRYLD